MRQVLSLVDFFPGDMGIHSVDLPGVGSFTLLEFAGDYRVRIVFIDRCRLEFSLTSELCIDRHSVFKFLDSSGSVNNLSWSSQSVSTLGLTTYLDHAIRFVQSLQPSDQSDSSYPPDVSDVVQHELRRIRTARAVHLR